MTSTALASMCRLMCGPAVEWRCDPLAKVQRIYFANHSSHLDFVVVWSALPAAVRRNVRPVAGRDYWCDGALRRYLSQSVFHAILIDRRSDGPPSADAARAAVEYMAHEMGNRFSLIVFPEGTRSANGEIGAFRSGLYHLARLRHDAEVVPVHLENLNRILPKGEILPVPMLSRLRFGEALPRHPDETKDQFLVRSRHALLALQEG